MRQSVVLSYWCLDSTQASDCAEATDAKQLEDNEPEAVLTAGSDHSKDDQIFIDYEPLAAHPGLGSSRTLSFNDEILKYFYVLSAGSF